MYMNKNVPADRLTSDTTLPVERVSQSSKDGEKGVGVSVKVCPEVYLYVSMSVCQFIRLSVY